MTGQKKKPGASERSWLVRDNASGLSLFSIRFHIRFHFRADTDAKPKASAMSAEAIG